MLEAQTIRQHSCAEVCGARRYLTPHVGATGAARRVIRAIGRAAMVQTYELAMMAAAAATLPLHLVNPVHGNAEPLRDLPATQAHVACVTRPVLLVHGFCGAKSSWALVARSLRTRGLTVDAITYAPFGNSVEQLADRLVAEVERMLSRTGADKVHLVGHSLGGVVIAHSIAGGRLNGLVDAVITLGSPFGGSPWAYLLPFGAIVPALRGDSPLLRCLAATPAPEGVRWLAFSGAQDIVVPGLRSVPVHARVESIRVNGVGHLGMLMSHQVVGRIADALSA
jgi:triacylglycerol lipase